MSVLEKKGRALELLALLQDDNAIDEVLEFLKSKTASNIENALNLPQHYQKIKEQYETVLEKLAQ